MNMYGDFVVTGIIASYSKQPPGGSLVKERKFTKRHQSPVNELVLLFGHIAPEQSNMAADINPPGKGGFPSHRWFLLTEYQFQSFHIVAPSLPVHIPVNADQQEFQSKRNTAKIVPVPDDKNSVIEHTFRTKPFKKTTRGGRTFYLRFERNGQVQIAFDKISWNSRKFPSFVCFIWRWTAV